MAIVEGHWSRLTDKQLQSLAEQYLLEIRENEGKEYEEGTHYWGQLITNMGFWSPPALLWKFILLAVSLAETDRELGDISAGSIEYLLGRAGEDFIGLVEQEARINPKFARTLTGCDQYSMTDEVWSRVQNLQQQVTEPLK